MEYSHQDVDRKFRNSTTRASVSHNGVTTTGFFYIEVMEEDEDGHLKVFALRYPTGEGKWYYVSTQTRTTSKYPRMELLYWNPDSGIYRGMSPADLFLVTRRLRRTFNVGLNNTSYYVTRFVNGKLSEPVSSQLVDPTKPRLFEPNSVIYSEKIYRLGNNLMFQGQRMGLVQDQKILLSDPDYIHFLPEEVRGSCITSL